MPRGKKNGEETIEEEVLEPQEEVEETAKGDIVVVDDLGNVKRVFNSKNHGKEAANLAKSFAKKFGYTVK